VRVQSSKWQRLEARRVVLVHAHAALSDVAGVLLSVRRGPAAEGLEVTERWVVVVVRVPQRQGSLVGEAGGAEDGRPLTGGRVNAALHSVGRAGVHQVLVPGLVAGGTGRPVLTALNVEPDTAGPLALAVAVQVRHQLTHLRSRAGGTGGAREHVGVSGLDASVGSVLDGSANVRVDGAAGPITTGNHETNAGRVEATGPGRRDGGTHIHTVRRRSGGRGRAADAALEVGRASAVARVRLSGAFGGLHAGATAVRSVALVLRAALNVRRTGAKVGGGGARAAAGRHTDADSFNAGNGTGGGVGATRKRGITGAISTKADSLLLGSHKGHETEN